MIVDTHCHLDDERFDDDLDDVILRAKEAGVEKIIIPGADMKDLKKARDICYKYENIYFAAGVHPYHHDNFDIDFLKEMAEDKKCVAIGECGLDYYHLKEDFETQDERDLEKQKQKKVFLAQIDLASELKKPLIVHIRDANQDSFDILKENSHKLVGGVLHCFNSSELLLGLKDHGFHFGIGGVLTFKNAKALVEILPKIPLEKLLVETDAPYLAPVPNRGKRNEPSYTRFVVEKMSEILNIERKRLEEITTFNAKSLFLI
ncbi:ssDNA/RNA exonuclease, 3' - 5' specific [Campylobacter blaseri]|uniref:Hydrolase TatD n=1 Tax=Campylobacter blaseri TaxID=2042961 RepID=A0A2P8R000_9BACT|nr:TatD family hydrolase [Campylobacter blaseri]PSM51831.1 hydrolase TatD [Campylobacter blaseri]PSM53622.1 hydrolase TatD [Campylobacter blaseri]QKF86437.1 ssDNA/RNA exonuclease, 3' - 5' specific [Campylobacter blaseri]